MPSLYLLIPIALTLVAVASLLYWWATSSGQYDDLDREGSRILFDEANENDQINQKSDSKAIDASDKETDVSAASQQANDRC